MERCRYQNLYIIKGKYNWPDRRQVSLSHHPKKEIEPLVSTSNMSTQPYFPSLDFTTACTASDYQSFKGNAFQQ